MRTDSPQPYDDGLYGLLTLFVGGVALSIVVAHAGAPALLVGFPAVLALAVALEALGRRQDPARR
ncbi:hypothetical protein ACQEVB_04735 [Pseudonocardia sp. CA-107938]|uniref:hypothetical protein n=1 Tax=Pseudonocardia sp. CA-107938 TaxID=3240021 RepID=UPI003D932764